MNFAASSADAQLKEQPVFMASQLGRTILSQSISSADEMIASPDERGSYGELDELIHLIAAQASDVALDSDSFDTGEGGLPPNRQA